MCSSDLPHAESVGLEPGTSVELGDVVLPQPLRLAGDVTVRCTITSGTAEVHAGGAAACAQASDVRVARSAPEVHDLAAVKARCAEEVDVEEIDEITVIEIGKEVIQLIEKREL